MAYLGSESLARGGWTSIEISRNHASASSGLPNSYGKGAANDWK